MVPLNKSFYYPYALEWQMVVGSFFCGDTSVCVNDVHDAE